MNCSEELGKKILNEIESTAKYMGGTDIVTIEIPEGDLSRYYKGCINFILTHPWEMAYEQIKKLSKSTRLQRDLKTKKF